MKGRAFLFAVLFAAVGLSVGNYVLALQQPCCTSGIPGACCKFNGCNTRPCTCTKAEVRVIRLPEDGGKFYTSVFVEANNLQVAAWFKSHSALASLKAQTHYNVFQSHSVMYKTRYAGSVKTFPCVVVQTPDGKVVFKQTKPTSASKLAADIAEAMCPWRNKRKPKPEPDPKPEPEPDVDVDVDINVPDTEPVVPDTKPPADESLPLWLAVALGVGGAAVGAASKLYENKEK